MLKRGLGLLLLLSFAGCAEGGAEMDAGVSPPPMDAGSEPVDGGDPNEELDGEVARADAMPDAGPPCADDDADGICNELDACTAGDDGVDTDGDGVPDACDCDQSASSCAAEATCEDGADGVVCTCMDGYSGDGTTCAPNDCGAPPAPTNGTVDAPVTTLGSTATYACNTSYDLVGDMTRTCQADGTWSGTVPLCLLGDCGPLVSPENGSVMATSTMVGDTATYACNTGYQLVGSASRTCGSDRTWSGSAPTCVLVDAPVTTLGSTATYACNTGYQLVGSASRTCGSDRTWSGSAPTCVLVDCGTLSPPANGTVSAPTTTYGATGSYACDFGYLLSGSATRTCQGSGAWSGSAPTCGPVDCGSLTSPSNGNVSYASTTFGSTATYACNGGYTLSGSASRTCEGSGAWSGSTPSCVSSGCGTLSSPANGTVSAPSTAIGDFATYTCNSGHQILGSTRRVCESSSNWSGAAPTCGVQLSCGCGGTYYEGERVVAAVNGPSGASGVLAGQMGTVIAGNAAPSTLQVLIEWDGWASGHNGNCSTADCGTCTPSPVNNRWYTACDQIRTARLTCSCSGAYSEGDRVTAIVDNPAGATGITRGHRGTVIAGNAPPATLGVLIEWDGWTSGHNGNCSTSDCGECVASATTNRWYVPCDSVSVLP